MSGKAEKKVRALEKEAEQEWEGRKAAMMADLQKLSEKYRIDLAGVIDVAAEGIRPLIAFIDVKEKYEAEVAAKEAEALATPEGKEAVKSALEV